MGTDGRHLETGGVALGGGTCWHGRVTMDEVVGELVVPSAALSRRDESKSVEALGRRSRRQRDLRDASIAVALVGTALVTPFLVERGKVAIRRRARAMIRKRVVTILKRRARRAAQRKLDNLFAK